MELNKPSLYLIPYEATQGEKLYAEILVGGETQLYKTGEYTAP